MPIYEYICESCHQELEVIQKISEPQLVVCPTCKKSTLKRKASMSAFHLKGAGWYKDGYSGVNGKSKSDSVDTTPSTTTTESATAPKTDASPAKTDVSPPKTTESSISEPKKLPSSKAS
ncbi:zinc ribbon domain-containing protein [bacterium]|nr:zinc ribbon domain-containing protein [bacterium]